MAELRWGSATHPGQIRPANEDDLYAEDGIFVVADGMGGHAAGEVASKLAIERIRDALHGDGVPTPQQVVDAISDANGDIFRAAIANPGQAGMGTTVTAIAVVADPLAGRGEPNIDANDGVDDDKVTPVVPKDPLEALLLANVGDSRTYLYRHQRLRRVTVDHNYVQELIAAGEITDAEARHHPRRNIITRALGIEPDVSVDWWTLPLVRGDRFVLCSDGLVDEVTDEEISGALLAHGDPQEAADRLVEMANENGGRDNVTVIVVDVVEGDDPPDPTQEIDVVPTWADEPGRSTAELSEAEMAAVLAAGAAANGTAGGADETTDGTGPAARRPRRLRRMIVVFLVLAALVLGFVGFASWARRGYFVAFDDDVVTVYQGRPGGVLWFDPTFEATGPDRDELTDDAIDAVEDEPTFSSRGAALEFVTELETIESTDPDEDAATTTTTVAPTTTRPTTTTPTTEPTTTAAPPPTTTTP